jgi:hypothetical protein
MGTIIASSVGYPEIIHSFRKDFPLQTVRLLGYPHDFGHPPILIIVMITIVHIVWNIGCNYTYSTIITIV